MAKNNDEKVLPYKDMFQIIHPNRWFIWCVVFCFFAITILWWQSHLFLLEQEQLTNLMGEQVMSSDSVRNGTEESPANVANVNKSESGSDMTMQTFSSSNERIWTLNKNSENRFSVSLSFKDVSVVPPQFIVEVVDPRSISLNGLDGSYLVYDENKKMCYTKWDPGIYPDASVVYDEKKVNGYTVCSHSVGDAGSFGSSYYIISPDGAYALLIGTGGDGFQKSAPIEDVLQTVIFTPAIDGGYDFEFKYPGVYNLWKRDSIVGDGMG